MDATEETNDGGNQNAGKVFEFPATIGTETENNAPKKRGRPKGSKTGTGNPETKSGSPTVKSNPSVDPAIVADIGVSLFEISDDLFVSVIRTKAKRVLEKEHFEEFNAELERIRLGEKDKDHLRKVFIALIQKYPVLGIWGPEIGLLVFGVQYTSRMSTVLRNVKQWEREQAKSNAS